MSETAISREIAATLRRLGFKVYVTSRSDPKGRRTTKGLPDQLVAHPRGPWTFAEIKTATGKLRPDQAEFRALCACCGIPWQLWRSVDDARAWAVSVGILAPVAEGPVE